MQGEAFPVEAKEQLRKTIETARGGPIDTATYFPALEHGLVRTQYCNYLLKSTGDELPHTLDLTDLHRELLRRIRPFDIGPLLELLTNGQTVVILECHGGLRSIIRNTLKALGFPTSFVGNYPGPEATPEDFFVNTTHDDLPVRFAKLCQLMRKGPRTVEIVPDGPLGVRKPAVIAGKPVQIGVGAARLAYYGKSTYAFACTRWVGEDIETSLTIGPNVVATDTMDDAETKLIRFYVDCVTEGLRDDPLNFPSVAYLPDFTGTENP